MNIYDMANRVAELNTVLANLGPIPMDKWMLYVQGAEDTGWSDDVNDPNDNTMICLHRHAYDGKNSWSIDVKIKNRFTVIVGICNNGRLVAAQVFNMPAYYDEKMQLRTAIEEYVEKYTCYSHIFVSDMKGTDYKPAE